MKCAKNNKIIEKIHCKQIWNFEIGDIEISWKRKEKKRRSRQKEWRDKEKFEKRN